MDKMKVIAPLDPAFEPIYRGLQAFAAARGRRPPDSHRPGAQRRAGGHA